MMQMRTSQADPRLYNPNRDVAHNFGHVMLAVADSIEAARWPALMRLSQLHAITDEELGQACSLLCRFVLEQKDYPKDSMATCLQRVGFLDLPEMARVIVMAYIGNITLGMHFAGVREATLDNVGPLMTYPDLVAAGEQLLEAMRIPRWRRWLFKLNRRWKQLRGKEKINATASTTNDTGN